MSETPPKKHVLTSTKLWFSTPNPHVRGKYASFGADVYMGNPMFVLKTGDPAEANKEKSFGRIEARMDLMTFMSALSMIESIIDNPAPDKKKITCMNHVRGGDGQRGEVPVHVSDLIVGRNADGVMYVSVVSIVDTTPTRRIQIPLDLPNKRYHNIIGSDGKIMAPADRSNLAARAFVNMCKVLIPMISNQTYEPPMMGGGNFQQRSQGGGGGGNRGGQPYRQQAPAGGGGGGFDSGMDDDIPF